MAFVPDQPSSRFVPDSEPSQPAKPKGTPLPANAGMVNFASSVLGIPVDAVTNVLNLGIAGAGVATGTTPSLIEKPFGGSESIRDILRRTGQPGLSPDNPNPDSGTGTAAYTLTSRGGFMPGGVLPAAGSMIAEKIGGPQWAGVGAMLPSAATMAYNEARAPALAAEQQRNVVRDRTLNEGRDAGYVVPPSQVNPTFLGNRLESIGGKAAINQEATHRNQNVTNDLVRQELRLPPNTPLTEQTLNAARNTASQPYRDVAGLSPLAQTSLQRLRDARSEATRYFRHYDVSATPDSLRTAQAAQARAEMLERVLEREATSRGRPELVNQLREARTYLAKTYDVERALNVGNGNVDARTLGRALDRGRPLTGNLERAARFSEAFPQVTRESSVTPAAGVSALEPYGMAGLGVGGFAAAGWPGVAAAALPLLRPGARTAALSDMFQGAPSYGPAVLPEGSLQMLLRQAVLSNEQARNR